MLRLAFVYLSESESLSAFSPFVLSVWVVQRLYIILLLSLDVIRLDSSKHFSPVFLPLTDFKERFGLFVWLYRPLLLFDRLNNLSFVVFIGIIFELRCLLGRLLKLFVRLRQFFIRIL